MANPVPTYRQMWPIYQTYWDEMIPKDGRLPELKSVAQKKLLANKDRYKAAQEDTGVPWPMIAGLHWRESSARFDRQLAQGDPLNKKSVNVPKGRGPFASWEESAVDALVTLKHLNKVVEWRLEKQLYYSEQYNGWGYWQYRGRMPSPYLWGASNIQRIGKYVADGKWDPNVWDKQLGVAALMKVMAKLDSSIKFVRED